MFSIITANWNGEKLLKIFLKSLINQTYKDFKLYLVDNGSTDNSIEIIKKYQNKLNIEVIKLEKNFGFAKANNIGINRAMSDKNEYIITLNNDIELDKNCLAKLKENINTLKNEYDVFQILLLNYYERNKIDAAGISFNKYYLPRQVGYNKPIDFIIQYNNKIEGVCAGAAVYSKKCLNAVKFNNEYFDSKFFAYYEDVDLSLRLIKAGFKSYLIKDAIGYHIHSATGGKNTYFKSYFLSRNLHLYLKKNLDSNLYKKTKIYIILFC
ncbi:MAG: glycosyltransferase family 2 protein [Thermosipho sp. (in: Bacteria)]|nr:glycosyltransferase family 2 protein [Thermosipho sp. (in: thermotogales)]